MYQGMDKTLISFGHGYSAQALAAKLLPQGWQIYGTTRSSDKAAQIAKTGVIPVLWEDLATLPLDQASHILVSSGPTSDGDPVLAAMRDQIAQNATRFDWVGYLSTTAVYGDHDGGWVDETTALTPASRRGQMRVDAETAWGAIPGLPLHIFRLAGIYGPDRGPFAKVRAGKTRQIIKPGQVFSRIHVEDIAQVLAASINRPNPGAAYNVCDDLPAPPQDVIAYAAKLLNVPTPPPEPFDQADMTPMARSFYGENKRVRNDRIKTELGVELAYPDFVSGLDALFQEENQPG